MKTATVEQFHAGDDFRHRVFRLRWIGGHLIWVSLQLFDDEGFQQNCPWRLFPFWYSRKRGAYLCWRLDWITTPHEVIIRER